VSLTTGVEEDGKVTIVVGFSQKLKDIKKDIQIEILGDNGESLYQELDEKSYGTSKNISSAWAIQLP
jgi:hypothetical protein